MTEWEGRSPDGANGSRECAPDDRLRVIRTSPKPRVSLRSTRATNLDFIQPQFCDLAARAREFFLNIPPPEDQRAQGMPGTRRARSLACKNKKAYEHSHHGHTGSPGIPRAMVLTVSFALSPVTGLFCHRRFAGIIPQNLTPASGRQDHTTSPSAKWRSRQQRRLRPPDPALYVRDDRETPLERSGTELQ
jgi:hypothetical protein